MFLTTICESFIYSASLVAPGIIFFFKKNLIINRYVEIYHCDFNLHFPNNNGGEHISTCLFAIYVVSSVKCLLKSFAKH